MKFDILLLPIALLATTVVGSVGVASSRRYDVNRLATRELDEGIALSARAVRENLALRALYHAKRQSETHADFLVRAVDVLDNALYPRWGSGKYMIDEHTYHREVKPKILAEMSKIKDFVSKCGKNPDFHVERDGTVYPSSRTDTKGLCKKSTYSKNLHVLLSKYVGSASKPAGRQRRKRSF